MTVLGIIAATLFFSRFVLAAVAVSLCVILFRRYRHEGWLLLAIAYLEPFVLELIRWMQGKPLLTYQTVGPVVNGAMQLNYRLEFPVFYLIAVAALLLLARRVKPIS